MRRWGGRLALLILLAALGVWIWNYFFPGPEKVIRRELIELARLATYSSKVGDVDKMLNAKKMANLCTPDVELAIDASGYRQRLSNRDELLNGLLFARAQLSYMTVDFYDMNVTLGPNKEVAVVNLTLRGNIPTDKDMIVQECKFTMKKIGRTWFIRKIETVKTLSWMGGLSSRRSPAPMLQESIARFDVPCRC